MHIPRKQWSWNSNFQQKQILENTMNFLPNVSFNSPFVAPIIQDVGLEK
jgi:hypothetical protein